MWCSKLLRSTPARMLLVIVGLSLIVWGSTHPSLTGLVLMMVGMVPTVSGLAGICLLDEVHRSRRARNLPPGQPREGRA
ncbi:MAG: DUF2892 domain-containing protein [Acidobacteria bacterium]|nr:DUF2892 domain-containing protein [Acidobacteriota bacterium]